TREGASGTRETFEKYVEDDVWGELEDDPKYKAIVSSYGVADGNPAMSQDVTDTDSSCGYVGLAYVDEATQMKFWVIPDEGTTPVEPKQSTILDATYPISRFLHLWTTPDVTVGVEAFLEYLFSPKGQEIVYYEGYVPLYDLSAYDFLYMN
ncbi:MAG: hypothetical protein GF317_17060, partial [Candidatus Lokiarchaeota archaeon]|nr:hypothetical protein [Candidatus Lokiarchaeota archaeon]MBD3201229.1 hypothetical protein [Candidatus Lokiarchaeota archaeon]